MLRRRRNMRRRSIARRCECVRQRHRYGLQIIPILKRFEARIVDQMAVLTLWLLQTLREASLLKPERKRF